MSGGLGGYSERGLLDELFGGTNFSPPATIYACLLTDSNTDAQHAAGTYTEPSGNGYSRVAITNNPTNFPASSGTAPASKTNGTAIVYPTPTGAGWPQLNAVLFTDSPTAGAGNIVGHAVLATPIPAAALGVQIPAGSLVITLN